MTGGTTIDKILSFVDVRSEQLGLSDRAISMHATSSPDTIRNMRKRGVIPKIDTVEAVCDLLELQIEITEKPISNAQYAMSGLMNVAARAYKEAQTRSGRERLENLNKNKFNSENRVAESPPAYALDPEIDEAEHVLVPKLDVKLAAGHGAAATDERPVGMLAFRREWMRKYQLRSGQVSAVEVSGDSMTPYLKNGDTILVDHRRNRPRRGAVVAARANNNLFVKRLEQTPDKDWLLVSDNHEYAPLALGEDDAVIGEVVWRGRWLG